MEHTSVPLRHESRIWWAIAVGTLFFLSSVWVYNIILMPTSVGAAGRVAVRLSYLPFISVLLRLAQRWPIEGDRYQRHALYHVLAGSVFTIIHLALTGLLLGADVWYRGTALSASFLESWFARGYGSSGNFIFHLLWYWAVIGFVHAYRYYDESQQKTEAMGHLRASLMEARLHALRSELNPHFLFNTLNSISAFALKGDRERVAEMLASLSTLLRIALDDKRPDIIPLDTELEFITTYLELQQIRFADRLSVKWEVDPEVKTRRVPSMILQPLVENAIKHGVSARPGPAHILVRARAVGDKLQIEVSDSGPGFGATPTAAMKHVGLTNTEARLAQLYGAAQRVDYRNTQMGASVTISLPLG